MKHTLRYLFNSGLISEENYKKILREHESRPLSIYWHIRIVLYLGVTFIAGSLGVIIYEHIDQIGHLTLILSIAIAMIVCFFFAFRQIPHFSTDKIESENPWTDYLVLLACLLFLTLEGYLQAEYSIFGERYGLATIIPALIMFGLAYRFDHLGILSIAISLLASWLGISLTPRELFTQNDFSTEAIVYAGILLCIILLVAGIAGNKKDVKKHFTFTYFNFGFHVGAVAIIGAAFNFDYGEAWLLLILPLVLLAYFYGKKNTSFYAILCAVIYAYIAASYWFVESFLSLVERWEESIILGYILYVYFIASAILTVQFLRKTYKMM